MTTVYIDKRCGLVLTDSRVTYTVNRAFLGIFPLRSVDTYNVVSQKSMYIHDRLFTACGNVSDIDKVLNYLVSGDKIIPNRKGNCHCILIDKEYCIHFVINNGKFEKYVEFIDYNYVFSMGSGSTYMMKSIKLLPKVWNGMSLSDFVIKCFSTVHKKDKYTDNNINLYKI